MLLVSDYFISSDWLFAFRDFENLNSFKNLYQPFYLLKCLFNETESNVSCCVESAVVVSNENSYYITLRIEK